MTIVVGHRGASAYAPENTLAAFRLAVEQGADAIELDIHRTADGQLAVIHDETLDRTTGRSGRVADLAMHDIRAATGQEAPVPTLPEVLAWLPAGIGLVVEIKARGAVEAAVSTLRHTEVRRDGRLCLISFDKVAIDRARELDRELVTGYLLVPGQSIERGVAWAAEHGHPAVLPWEGDLGSEPAPLLRLARALGRRIGTYVVNDPARMQALAVAGLWAFVTDTPDVARATLGPRHDPRARFRLRPTRRAPAERPPRRRRRS